MAAERSDAPIIGSRRGTYLTRESLFPDNGLRHLKAMTFIPEG